MNHAGIAKNLRKPRILVAPLDWGLGHATRCIPIVRQLLGAGYEVWLAGEGAQEILLKTEFPELNFLSLEGYRAHYSRSRWGLLWKMLLQTPRFLKQIRNEHNWLAKVVDKYGFDAVISDNRYGLYNSRIPCFFITHQLWISSPLGNWSSKLIQRQNYHYINRFTECWIPDTNDPRNLAGKLSNPASLPKSPVRYIGPLSRFENKNLDEKKKQLLILLSGPEPQRTIFEEKIIKDIAHYNGYATIVRGLPANQTILPSTNMLRFYNHLPATELNKEMAQAELVICRSGYSSIMDLATLEKKGVLVPTPGQTEQEYLGYYLEQKNFAPCISQDKFSLAIALQKAEHFHYHPGYFTTKSENVIPYLQQHLPS